MSSRNEWLDGNAEYLAASMRWLRLRLARLARPDTKAESRPPAPSEAVANAVAAPPSVPLGKKSWFGAGRNSERPVAPLTTAVTGAAPSSPPVSPGVAAAPPAPTTNDAAADADQMLAEAASLRETAAAIDPPPALLFLAERLGLSVFERDTLLLCAAAELDPAIESLFAAAQGGSTRAFATFGLALRAFDDPTWDTLSPHRPLRHARLLEINQPGATPLAAAALRADERIVNLLKGMNAFDERIAALITPLPAGEGAGGGSDLAPSQRDALEAIRERVRLDAGEAPAPVYLLGTDTGSKLAVASELCVRLNRRLYCVALDALPTTKSEIETFARLWQREQALLPVALYIDAEKLDAATVEHTSAFQALIMQEFGLVFVSVRDAPSRVSTSHGFSVEVDRPTPGEQRDAWMAALCAVEEREEDGAVHETTAKLLAGQFSLNIPDIRQAARLAVRRERTGPLRERVWDACRNSTQPRLDALAQRLVPKATWGDLVLSDESAGLLRQIAGQVRERYRVYEDWGYARKMTRGLGISALFTGESGVGKTMAAEVIANDLRLHLYRIDLSAVVSKYIGETEKNLRRLFDAAEQGGAMLLFDEADALFGKRSEIKDSHDRYANIEINYLLQRMEAFSGLAILATNMKGALDHAFMRRLRFVVNFQFPGPSERRLIWEKALPPSVPRAGLDYQRLARFNLSGGNIHSVALNAAFMAAQRATPVTAPLIMTAVRYELRKLDKPINEAEFR